MVQSDRHSLKSRLKAGAEEQDLRQRQRALGRNTPPNRYRRLPIKASTLTRSHRTQSLSSSDLDLQFLTPVNYVYRHISFWKGVLAQDHAGP